MRRPERPRLAWLAVLPWLVLPLKVNAFDMESGAPISVKANNARLDDNAGKATYTGNVLIEQAETRLYADRVELYRDEQGLQRIQAFGEPARYEQTATAQTPATDARAAEIEFESADSLLTFRRDAVIRQANDVFRGDVIRYDTEQRVVTAERAEADDSEQVEMIIYPRRGNGSGGGNGAAESQ